MLPKIGPFANMQKAADKVDEKQINRVEAIINSMTPYERDHHEVINGSRRKRIARGSGTIGAGSQSVAAAVRADAQDVQEHGQAQLRPPHGGHEAAGNVGSGWWVVDLELFERVSTGVVISSGHNLTIRHPERSEAGSRDLRFFCVTRR